MEVDNAMQTESVSEEDITSKGFTFSKPNIISNPTTTHFGLGSEHVLDVHSNKKDVFTFAAPTTVSNSYKRNELSPGRNKSHKFKSQARDTTKASANVFAHALKSTGAFQQLKRNARSQTMKEKVENSITCSKVPKALLTKAAAKEYFTRYGTIAKVTIRPKKRVIMVFYSTKAEATEAYCNSGEYAGERFNVEWTKSDALAKSPPKKKDSYKNLVTNLLKTNDDDVRSELEAMISLDYINEGIRSGSMEASSGSAKRNKNALKHDKPRIEKAIGKSEKPESDSQIPMLLPTMSTEELQKIIQQAAFSSEDRFKVLEARDRLMRLKRVKSHSLATAKVTSGTCPDMCPEKERLMRESQRQVAPYERSDSNEYKINHAIAIKQYSRSSADQEEPMAHELRPVKSLKMTMSYMLHEIVNLCEQEGTNLAEWYHFMWDRMRSIRKDITQQELCCYNSVELVEQCARFHIVCSERLCAEEPSVFDKKINSENLTKCLQSLKYMYNDLRVKGIACKNEPEFWAYIILLNLNNGNFMWDLQRLPTSIQRSREVQFAITVYSALESNNYYKFFNLVRSTTYLNACILLRYFNQVRVKALSIMVKAYCRTMSTAYPLYELIDILGFEDESEAIYFCEQVGLNVSNDEMHVMLNRQNFSLPAINIEQGRAHNMVEYKRTSLQLSIAQCIAGEEMPEKTYENHKPHNSFDVQGYLIPEAVDAKDQTTSIKSEQEDPYEFVDEDMPESDQQLPKYESNKNAYIGNVFSSPTKQEQASTTQPEICTTSSSTFKMPSTFGSTANIFALHKPDTFSFKPKPITQIIPENKSEKDEKDYIDASEHPSKIIKNSPLINTTKHTETFSFGNTTKNPFSSQTSSIFTKQPTVPYTFATSTPFSTTGSKSIFSGASQSNIFLKQTGPTTVFTNNQIKPQISSDAASQKLTNNKDTSVSHRKEIQDSKQNEGKTESASNLELEELERKKRIQRIEENASSLLNDIETYVIEDYCSTIVREEMNNVKMYNTITENIFDEILNRVSYEICSTILTEEIDNQRRIQEIQDRMRTKTIMKYFNVWKRYAHKRKRQREALSDTPVWLQKCSVDTCAGLLYDSEQDVVIRNMRKRGDEKPLETLCTNYLAPIEMIIYSGIKENLKSLEINTVPTLFWKLVISWPNLENNTALWRYKKIMNRYLCPDNCTTEPIMKTYRSNNYETLYVCIRHFEDSISDHNLVGSDALLFIAAAEENTKSMLRRLTKSILSREKLMPIPVAILILGSDDLMGQQHEIIVSELETLLDSGYVSEYTIAYEQNLSGKTNLNLTQSTILWLAINKSVQNPLEMDYLQNVYDICLTEELWLRIMGDLAFNSKLSHALKDPNFVIRLHNEAVTHLMDIILDPESLMYTKFAPEFKKYLKPQNSVPMTYEYFDDLWKKDEYRAQVENAMNSFILPHWNGPWPITDPKIFHEHATRYCRQVLSRTNGTAIACNILSKIFLLTGSLEATNFIDILLYIFKEKLHLMSDDLKVIYNKNHVKHFRTLPWWFKSNAITDLISQDTTNTSNNEIIEPVSKKRRATHSERDDSLSECNTLAEFCENTQKQVVEVHRTSLEVENQLEAQKLKNQALEQKLRNALYGESEFIS